jgi:chondroitin AC lyase
MMGDMIICLGNSISSKSGLPVTTSVNQSFLKGEVVVKSSGSEKVAGETESLQNPQWIIHDNIGYFFPAGGKIQLETREVKGSWHWVASRYPEEIMKSRIFKLWLEHGNSPQNETYQYILVPNAEKSKMEEMEKNLQVKIRNDKDIQEVISSKGWRRAIIFHKAGKSDALGGVEVNQPCIVVIDELMGATSIRIADPTQKLEKIQIKLGKDWKVKNAKVDKNNTVTIEFPIDLMTNHSYEFSVQKE